MDNSIKAVTYLKTIEPINYVNARGSLNVTNLHKKKLSAIVDVAKYIEKRRRSNQEIKKNTIRVIRARTNTLIAKIKIDCDIKIHKVEQRYLGQRLTADQQTRKNSEVEKLVSRAHIYRNSICLAEDDFIHTYKKHGHIHSPEGDEYRKLEKQYDPTLRW